MSAGPLPTAGRDVTRQGIVALVAERHNLSVADLKGPSHARRIAWPRQEAMALMFRTGLWSRGQIGRALNRTCWTVAHGVSRHEARMAELSTRNTNSVDGRNSSSERQRQIASELMA